MTVYTVPWFPEMASSEFQEMTGMTVKLTMAVATTARKLGWVEPFDFGLYVGQLFDVLPGDLQTRVARAAIISARHLGLIEERDGKVGPSETLMRTRPWWES